MRNKDRDRRMPPTKTTMAEPPPQGLAKRSVCWLWRLVPQRAWIVACGVVVFAGVLLVLIWMHRVRDSEISALIHNEAQYLLDRDLRAYRELFDPRAVIADKQHSLSWAGQEDIEERARPLRFSFLVHTVQSIEIDGETATARTTTRFAETEPDPLISDSNEEWHFVEIGGKWKITSLYYGLPPVQNTLVPLWGWFRGLPRTVLPAVAAAVIGGLILDWIRRRRERALLVQANDASSRKARRGTETRHCGL